MFVIACKYDNEHKFIYDLVDDIRKYHQDEEILIVDSDSKDKSYFELKDKYNNIIIDDVSNKNFHMGAYWYAYDNYVRDFYYFLHDSMRVKSNLDYLKDKELTVLAHFPYSPGGDIAREHVLNLTKYSIVDYGIAVYGPIFFCRRDVMDKLHSKNFNKLLPTHNSLSVHDGIAAYALEGAIGMALTQEGYDIKSNSLHGDVYDKGITRLNPNYDKVDQFPIEKIVQINNRRF